MEKSISNNQKGYIVPISIIAGLFFIFGFVTWINGALIPFMRSICELTETQAYLVASASYISFVVMALPASYILKKIGYKKGMSIGLLLMCVGALVFIPAAASRTYTYFLFGIFIMGAGMTILQTASNPYITLIGPKESAAKRISIMGICNKVAGMLGSAIFGALLLSGIQETQDKIKLATETEKGTLLDTMADSVVMPYVVMAVILFILGVLILKAPLPEIEAEGLEVDNDTGTAKTSIFQFPHLWLGVIALFVYVGAEVIAGDTIINYGLSLGIPAEEASFFTSFTLGAMVATYLLGVLLIPKVMSQGTALKISAVLGIVLSLGILFTDDYISVLFVASLGVANALVWPAIWPLALDGLGKFTKTASALLIMAIAGGAVIPPLYGLLVDGKKQALILEGLDKAQAGAQASTSQYWILIPCYFVIFYFAMWGHRIGLKKS
jgi:MFS transporter, FHS family, L-fucose permease